MIFMTTKNQIKYYSSLLQKKYRESEKKFIVEGKRIVEEGIKSKYKCEAVLITKEFESKEKNFLIGLNNQKIKPAVLSSTDFKKISDTKTPQGIAAVFSIGPILSKNIQNIQSELIVGLENINDPGNMGTILRTCDWFNINNVIISSESVEVFNPKVLRSSMGSVFHLNIFPDVDFRKGINFLKELGYKFICADIEGINIYEFGFPKKTILFFCSEAKGPSKELLENIDEKITIPKYGKAESLNVSSAVSAALSEIKREKGSR
jgi:RNA methyltransferase, TrmH family